MVPNPIPGADLLHGALIGLKRFGALNSQGLAELNALLLSSPGKKEWGKFVKSNTGAELMGLMRESVDEETVNYLAEDPTLLRTAAIGMGEVGAHSLDIGGAGVGLFRLGKAGVKKVAKRSIPGIIDDATPVELRALTGGNKPLVNVPKMQAEARALQTVTRSDTPAVKFAEKQLAKKSDEILGLLGKRGDEWNNLSNSKAELQNKYDLLLEEAMSRKNFPDEMSKYDKKARKLLDEMSDIDSKLANLNEQYGFPNE